MAPEGEQKHRHAVATHPKYVPLQHVTLDIVQQPLERS